MTISCTKKVMLKIWENRLLHYSRKNRSMKVMSYGYQKMCGRMEALQMCMWEIEAWEPVRPKRRKTRKTK